MERLPFLRYLFRLLALGIIVICVSVPKAESAASINLKKAQEKEKRPKEILKEIYDEVVAIGGYEDEDFLRRDFFMDLEDEDRSKAEHVVVLIRKEGEREIMLLQVTHLESRRKESIIKFATATKKISTRIKGKTIEIEKTDYNEDEIKFLLPKILENIRLKKEYLKLIKQKK
jgi:predicted ribonuclease YlaK